MSASAVLNMVNNQRSVRIPAALTERQLEVLNLVCEDNTNKAIAATLNISSKTVEKHRQHLAAFSNTHSPLSLYKWALANGYANAPTRVVDK